MTLKEDINPLAAYKFYGRTLDSIMGNKPCSDLYYYNFINAEVMLLKNKKEQLYRFSSCY